MLQDDDAGRGTQFSLDFPTDFFFYAATIGKLCSSLASIYLFLARIDQSHVVILQLITSMLN